MKHKSVLLNEVIESLNIKSSGIYVDCTLGYGGHSSKVLEKLKEGFLYAFDQDSEAIKYSSDRLSKVGNNFKIIKSNFKDIKKHIDIKVDGIMFDLGVSSPQLDDESRGFSFHKDAKLDMRMDTDSDFSAWNIVNEYPEEKLSEIFFKYGDEKYSRSIAKAIVQSRPINTTLELTEIIKESVPMKYKVEKHPARKVFQAIRIEVNNEIEILEEAVLDAFNLLNIGGRLSVITFHSLEDKVISKVFKSLCSDDKLASKMPIVPEELRAKAKNILKIVPSNEELEDNLRSRSAKLRVIERVR